MESKIKHLINYIVGNFFTKALAFLSIPILTRLLTTEDYGIISLYESLVMIFIPIIGLGMSTGISRNYFEKNNKFEIFLKNNLLFLFIFAGITSILLYMGSYRIANQLHLDYKIVRMAILGGVLGIIFDIYQRLLMSSKKSKEYNIVSVSKSLLVLSLTFFFAYKFEEKFYSKIYATLIFGILFLIILVVKYRKNIKKFKIDINHVKYTLSYSLPLVPAILSNFILAQFDRVAITNITGNISDTGLYSFAYNVGMIQQVIVLAIINTLRPYFYEYLNEGKYVEINKMVKKYSKFVYVSAIGLILFSKEIVLIMANENYYGALNLVPIIIIGYIFVFFYTLYFQYASYAKKTGTISINTFIAGIFNIYLNYKYIPVYGYKAAAYTTVVSYFVLFILHYCNSRFNLKVRIIALKIFYKDFILFIVIIMISFYILNIKNFSIAFGLKFIIVLITSYIYLVRGNEEWIKNGLLKKFAKRYGK
ncbi:oligosaccharide flippase family protein [uncultured Ilyobacter sp.]|uniref:oligosaccharide flippase family protein n=1 Tax=uncultured Ilyobacter sp. TaxID=544433 RepID=UPI0029F4B6D3|nr:oligosaccharide flippase family protein [uncultured Ilyobacter sp.]